MPSERGGRALEDIRRNARLALSFVGDRPAEAFAADVRDLYATIRCLEIVSEAARRLDPEIVAAFPHVPWAAIRAAGNIYRHEYADVSPERVWHTVTGGLPALLDAVERALAGDLPC